MSTEQRLDELLAGIERSLDEGRLAHAFLVLGRRDGLAGLFVDRFLTRLFAGNRPFDSRTHADIHWVEPASKSRAISVQQMRELMRTMQQTSFIGGWKAGVMLHADCMGQEAANAFLKTLEEPPDKSLLLMHTDNIDALLPTIISRCQLVNLMEPTARREEPWLNSLLEVLKQGVPQNPLHVLTLASHLSAILDAIKSNIESLDEFQTPEADRDSDRDLQKEKAVLAARVQARLLESRQHLMRNVQLWYRDIMLCTLGTERELYFPEHVEDLRRLAQDLTFHQALFALREVDRINTLLARNFKAQTAFEYGLLQIGIEAKRR